MKRSLSKLLIGLGAIWFINPLAAMGQTSSDATLSTIMNYFEVETAPTSGLLSSRKTVDSFYKGKAIDAQLIDIVVRDLTGDGSEDVIFLWKRGSMPDQVIVSAIVKEDIQFFNIKKSIIKDATDARIISTENGILELSIQNTNGVIRNEHHALLMVEDFNKIVPLRADQVRTSGQRAAVGSLTVKAPPGVRTSEYRRSAKDLCRGFMDSLKEGEATANEAGEKLVDSLASFAGLDRSDVNFKQKFAAFWNQHASFMTCGPDFSLRLPSQPLVFRAAKWSTAWEALEYTVFGEGETQDTSFYATNSNALNYIDGRIVTLVDMINNEEIKLKKLGTKLPIESWGIRDFLTEFSYGKSFEDLTVEDLDN